MAYSGSLTHGGGGTKHWHSQDFFLTGEGRGGKARERSDRAGEISPRRTVGQGESKVRQNRYLVIVTFYIFFISWWSITP